MRCPVCWSTNTLLVLSTSSHGRCDECGATWSWSGGAVTRIRRGMASSSRHPEPESSSA